MIGIDGEVAVAAPTDARAEIEEIVEAGAEAAIVSAIANTIEIDETIAIEVEVAIGIAETASTVEIAVAALAVVEGIDPADITATARPDITAKKMQRVCC